MLVTLRRAVLWAFSSIVYLAFINGCQQPKNEIEWYTNLDTAFQQAKILNKPLMIEFMATWCPSCQAMEKSTFNNLKVIARSRNFIPVKIDVDQQPAIAERYKSNARKYGGIGIPNILFLTAKEDTLDHIIGYYPPDSLVAVLDSVFALFSQRIN